MHPSGSSPWLLWQFVQRELTSRFAGSRLGLLWALANPLAQLLIYGFVFATVLKVRATGTGDTPFLVFLAIGLWPWMAFAEAVTRASNSVVQNAALIKKTPFRHDLVVYATVASSFVVQMLGYAIVIGYFAITDAGRLLFTGLPKALLAVTTLLILAQGTGLLLAALQVFVRDLEQAVAPLLQMLFYLSPILYAASATPDWVQALMSFNPIGIQAESLRDAWLLGNGRPDAREWATLAFALLIWALGHTVFRRLSPHFEEAL